MIYICIPTRNNARTIGLLLWKIRQVFQTSPREYHLLVADDASTDGTAEVLEKYQNALPLTIIRHEEHQGYAATLEGILRRTLRLTDRPKRDCVITLAADFSISPAVLPELVKRFESGADMVIAEAEPNKGPWIGRIVSRMASRLLRPGMHVPGVTDYLSGVYCLRLITLRRSLRDGDDRLFETEGLCVNAELLARTAMHARQIAAITVAPEDTRLEMASTPRTARLALDLFRTGRAVHIPEPTAEVQRVS